MYRLAPGTPRADRRDCWRFLLLGMAMGAFLAALANSVAPPAQRALCPPGAGLNGGQRSGDLAEVSSQCTAGAAGAQGWAAGVGFELEHHSGWIQGDSKYVPPGAWFQLERASKLKGETVPPYDVWICSMLRANNVNAKIILDHGAGPFTNLGSRLRCPSTATTMDNSMNAQVVSVDPLAPAYHLILNKHGIHNTQRPSFCKSEDLLRCFCPETFDLTIIVNALDHSDDAPLGWSNAVQLTRPGGIACVVTRKNEARKMNNKGFHQWNFAVADDALLFEDTRLPIGHEARVTNITAMMARMGAQRVLFEHDPKDDIGMLKACWLRGGGGSEAAAP